MAIRPEIALQARVPDIGKAFSNALMNVGRIDDLRRSRAEAPIRQRLLEAQTQTAEAAVAPQAQFNLAEQNRISSLATAARQIIPDLQSGNQDRVIENLMARAESLEAAGIDNSDTLEAIGLAQNNPQELLRTSQTAIDIEKQQRLALTKGGVQFGGQQTFKDEKGNLFFGTTKRDPNTGAVQSVLAPIGGGTATPQGQVSLVSPLGETAAEKVETEVEKERRKEEAKLVAQKKHKPEIEKAVIAARKEATERGDVFNELSQAKAALPGLMKAVNELRELATVATSTFGGRVFDTAVKETGFGSTKGATARAKFIAIVNNQVLPLLKPTFGGSFSVQEGESLKATMGDPDSSPAEKMAQLDAFIDQKMRDIEAKESLLQEPQPETTEGTPSVIKFNRQGQRIQ